ncbi:MAG: CesD/SycD/LcrH family type secretion system chaperone [Paucimonas sp.]|nr:CesD/SycD/LcrH family type secretion system chaperone [Paucimonas sp.]
MTMDQTAAPPIPPGVDLAEQISRVVDQLTKGKTLGELAGYTPEAMNTLYTNGYALYKQGKYAEACEAFRALVVFNHLDRRVFAAYAASLQMLCRYDEAVNYYALAAMMDVNDPAPVFHCAECLLAMNKKEEALASLEHVLDIPPRGAADLEFGERARALMDLLEQARRSAQAPAKQRSTLEKENAK